MTGELSLALRTAVGAVAGVMTAAVPGCKRFYKGRAEQFDRNLLGAFIASRLFFFLLVFKILHIAPRGDLIGYYIPEARDVLAGLRPYTGFVSSYAPLHAYMDAALLRLVSSTLTLIVFVMVAEWVALYLWVRVARGLWPSEDRMIRIASLLYLLSAVSLHLVAMDGQDNVLIALLLGLAVWLAMRRREFLSGAAVALSIGMVKFLPLIYVPVFWLTLERRWRWLTGCVAGLVAVYGVFAYRGFHILGPLYSEGHRKTAGGLPYVLETVFSIDKSTLWDGVLVLAFVCMLALLAKRVWGCLQQGVPGELLMWTLPAMTLLLLMLAKKTWPAYLMMAFYPICLSVAAQSLRRGWIARAAFGLFGLVCMVEHGIYETILHEISASALRARLLAHDGLGWFFFGVELLLVGGYGWLLALAIKALRRPAETA